MAPRSLRIDFDWENEKSFRMTAKWNDSETFTVLDIDENAHLADTWRFAEEMCRVYLIQALATIGKEMLA